MENTNGIALDDLFPPAALAAQNPVAFQVETIEWQIRNRHANGLASAVVKVGKKLLISKARYQLWLATQAGESK